MTINMIIKRKFPTIIFFRLVTSTVFMLIFANTFKQSVQQFNNEDDCRLSKIYKDNINYRKLICSYVTQLDGYYTFNNYHGEYDELEFIDSELRNIPVGVFGFASLQTLNISNCKLETIEIGAFHDVRNLQNMYLANNNLIEIQNGIFFSLDNLEIISLENNRIENIGNKAFNHLTKLKILNLENNRLRIIPDILFDDLISLETLNLNSNLLTKFEIHQLNLFNLFLNNNSLTEIPNYFCLHCKRLSKLDLSFNNIQTIEQYSFDGLRYLTTLLLQNNNITTIVPGCFRTLQHLTTLNISNNHINKIDVSTFSGLRKLEYLDISYNNISFINTQHFYALHNLIYLNVSGNLIKSLDMNLKQILPLLSQLEIDNNPWNCKDLLHLYANLSNSKVEISPGSSFTFENVNGILCNDTVMDAVNSPVQNSPSVENDFLNSKVLKDFLNFKTNPDLDFNKANKDLELYDQKFKNTTFYKTINSNLTFNLDINFKQVEKDMEQFNRNFQNTAFYKIFYSNSTKNASNPLFAQQKVETVPIIKSSNPDPDPANILQHVIAENKKQSQYLEKLFLDLYNNLNLSLSTNSHNHNTNLIERIKNIEERLNRSNGIETSGNAHAQSSQLKTEKNAESNSFYIYAMLSILVVVVALLSYKFLFKSIRRSTFMERYVTSSNVELNPSNL